MENKAKDPAETPEAMIGYVFRNKALLETALTTPACRMDHPEVEDNQRLEFLGDAVFGLLSGEAVFHAYPWEQEGALTVRRTHLVSGQALTAAAEKMGLARFLRRNKGCEPLPRHAKALADATEALMGAVWLDGGLEAARAFFTKLDLPIHERLNEWGDNPKGYLQVLSQAMHPPRKPIYETLRSVGPSHAPTVTVRVYVKDLGEATATAISLRQAEIDAAAKLLSQRKGT